jgi:hypothetical protein
MGVVTWKNIAPSNPAGILNAANAAAKGIGEGFAGVGDAIQGYTDTRVQSETDDFVADLMALGSQEERDAMIAEAEGGWLNIDNINKTNYELGAPDREQAAFTQQLADTFLSSEKSAEAQLIRDQTLHKYKADNPILTSSSTSKKSKYGTVKDPLASGGFIDLTYGLDESNLPFGTGMGPEDRIELAELRTSFLGKFPDDISVDEINKFINDGFMLFDDRASIPGRPDMWTFKFNDKSIDLDGSDESFAMLYEAVYKNVKKEDSTRTVVRADYFEDFRKNNPQFETFAEARAVFDKIYEKNLQNKYGYDDSGKTSASIFGLQTKESVTALDKDTSGYSTSTYINDVESQESRSNTISNDIKGLNNAEMQKLYETLIQRKYAGASAGGGGAGLNKDEAELLRQLEEQLAKEASLSSPGS